MSNLFICPDCNKEVSKTAKVCPHCGNKKIQNQIANEAWKNMDPKIKKNITIFFIGIFVVLAIFVLYNRSDDSDDSFNSIPNNWKGKKIYYINDGRDWIIINEDNSFILHEEIPNAQETYEWRGRVENMTLKTSKRLSYQGRNDYKPTDIDPKMEFLEIGDKFLRINFNGFSTLSGSNETDGRNYTLENKSPF